MAPKDSSKAVKAAIKMTTLQTADNLVKNTILLDAKQTADSVFNCFWNVVLRMHIAVALLQYARFVLMMTQFDNSTISGSGFIFFHNYAKT